MELISNRTYLLEILFNKKNFTKENEKGELHLAMFTLGFIF
jgi:hypothetical protein